MITTFVLGDVVGSTRLWAEQGERMPDALARLDTVVDTASAAHGGQRPVEQGEGDSFVVTFDRASEALAFAVEVQSALGEHDLDVRMAVHTGEAERREDGRWLGPALNRCARLRALAVGGQVLVSEATAVLAIDALPAAVTLRDLGRHRLRDLAAPEHVRQLCHPALIADFPPLQSLDWLPNNLPAQLSSFVGRQRELSVVATLLGEHRLVTITGAGGVGKTRLALHAAAERLDQFRDGVWLADLSATVDPARVPSALAGVLGVAENPFQPTDEALANRLVEAQILILLDNCEHLLDACSALAERLLRACPDVRILATSREPLGVDGEAAYRAPSLGLPGSDDDASAEAVCLFAERARAARPGFALDARTLPVVGAICRRLDGLPLAIELAAALVRVMAPAEIQHRLAARFDLLTAGRRGSLPRQRTLDASVQWSFDLLDDDQRAVLRRLSVFAGGFTLELAERVVGGDDVEEWAVVGLLAALVDRSLVQPDDNGERTRYRLLEAVRFFAAERLGEAGETALAKDRHLAAVVDFAIEMEADLDRGRGRAAIPALVVEFDNLRAALDWATRTGDAGSALRILAAAGLVWGFRFESEGYERGKAALALPGGDPGDRAQLQVILSWLAAGHGDLTLARELCETGLDTAYTLAAPRLVALAQTQLGSILAWNGDPYGLEVGAEGIAGLEALGDGRLLGLYGDAHTIGLALAGDLRRATAVQERVVEAARSGGNPWTFVAQNAMAAIVATVRGDTRVARAHASVAPADIVGLAGSLVDSLARSSLAWTQSAAGDHVAAVEAIHDQLERARRSVYPQATAMAEWQTVWIDWRAGRPFDREVANEGAALLALTGFVFGPPFLLALEAEHLLVAVDVEGATRTAERALALVEATIYAGLARPIVTRALARATLMSGDTAAAEDLAHQVLAWSVEGGDDWGVAEVFDLLAAIASATAGHLDAARMLGASDRVRDEIEWVRGVPDDALVNKLVGGLCDALGVDAYEAARAEGKAMSRDDAIAFVQRGRGKRGRPSFGWSSLTPTETDVVRLVAEGLANKAIADKLIMSPATVKTHLTHVYSKLGVATRAELAGRAAQRS